MSASKPNAAYWDSSPQRLPLVRPALLVVIVVLVALSASSCSSRNNSPASARTLTDELGRSVRAPARPQRIVSLAPSITEILFALSAGDRVAGVTSYCDYPAEAREKTTVGDTLKPSVERIVALKADLVIISTASQLEASFRALEELGIPVYVTNPRSIDGVIDSIDKLGELVDAGDRAHQLSAELRRRI
ncbi:MAG TPA: helical backbone metal receptor, partial [Blastocatellia bacterium]|nr:helical backbone metal receptor [Blastocatellia bacterium]